MKRSKLRWIGAVSVASVIFLGLIYLLTISYIGNSMEDQLRRASVDLKNELALRQQMSYDRLVESSYLMAENSTFKANFLLNDKNTVAHSAREFSMLMKVDLFAVVSSDKEVLFNLNDRIDTTRFASYEAINPALEGSEPAVNYEESQFYFTGSQLYQVVFVPVYAGRNTLLGVVMMGLNFDKTIIENTENSTSLDLAFCYNGVMINPTKIESLHSISEKRKLAQTVTALNHPNYHFIEGNDQDFAIFAETLGDNDDGIILAAANTSVFSSKNDLIVRYFWFILIALVVGYNLGIYLISRKLKPRTV